jgi:pimeloyl-ACP methyl ester carboxylesterase
VTPKGTIVLSHGLGLGGFSAYLNVADYFASKGYLVFGFDVTATGGSEGDSIGALEQGIIDLFHAIDYVNNDAVLSAYPLLLWGHSRGDYAVNTVLNVRPEVTAIISCASFESPSILLNYSFGLSLQYFPDYLPYKSDIANRFMLLEKEKVGAPYCNYTSLGGFANSTAKVMVIGGEKDINVPNSIGYDLYTPKYADDSRFIFVTFANRAHFDLYYTDAARAYYASYLADHPADPTTYQVDFSSLDKSKAFELDVTTMDQMVAFYQAACL